ncbi:MAG: hypothetical protein ACOCXA_08050 [Planctomycetota bacterium]
MWFRTKSKMIQASGYIETLVVHLNLLHGEFGDQEDRALVEQLGVECQACLEGSGVICKGDEYGAGEARLLFTCPDATVAWQKIRTTVLSRFSCFPIRIEIIYEVESEEGCAKTTAVQKRRRGAPLSFSQGKG